jgi:fucose permease
MVGLLPAGLLFFIRRNVQEPEIYQKKQADAAPFVAIFAPSLLRTTLPAALLMTGMQGGYHAVVTWLPTFLKTTQGLSVNGTHQSLAIVIVGSFCGYVTGAFMTDWLGRRWHLVIYSLCGFASVWAYTHITFSADLMMLLGFPLGFFASGIFSSAGAFLAELFPTSVRGSAQGFTYNFGRGVGALIPWLIGMLSAQWGLGEAIGIFAAGSYLLVFACVALLPETRGAELKE